ncbi:hypothetical protein EG68_07105 [Paragonimus skrjabini miyazakii]|uniref:Uncharacterized protein n=1 Tax=Paragonimus skrjabini miyazakii TaxID=59628 RepID=A0A8S9YTJ5_9TREM|nr:hypothetical protein EG68_07105 [Paragonimus skrjabini miyazakii]
MKTIKKNLQTMPELIDKFQTRQSKQYAVSETEVQRKKAIMEEARDRFGYYVDPRDPKFQKLREEIEEREKTARKQLKKSGKHASQPTS